MKKKNFFAFFLINLAVPLFYSLGSLDSMVFLVAWWQGKTGKVNKKKERICFLPLSPGLPNLSLPARPKSTRRLGKGEAELCSLYLLTLSLHMV